MATQIAEQSVDIDADLLISDLAPTDMLLQRLGRLWRHKREQRPCETPEVWIEMPSFDALGAHGKVYVPYVLLRSAEQWCQLESITLPDDIRRVLEATYSAPREDEPQEWKRLYEELEAKKRKLREYASSTTFVWQKCSLNDEESVSTRWSEVQTASLVLIRTQGNRSWTFLDGSTAVVTADWNFYAAQAIHRNLARVPYWMLTASDTSALRGYVPGTASLGIVGESGAIQLMGSNEESLVYDAQLGIISASHEPSE